MEFVKLKPTKEIMRDPITRIPLKKEGEKKPFNTFWRRRLLAEDVVIVKKSKSSYSSSTTNKKSEEKNN